MSPAAPRTVFVVLPAYDEAENLPPLLARVRDALASSGLAYAVIVVDDGSRDGTAAAAEAAAAAMPVAVVRHAVNQGLGAALRDGLAAALARAGADDVVVTMDADDTHVPDLIPVMVARLDAGADVVIASRFVRGARVHGVPVSRRALSRAASWLLRLRRPTRGVRDYTCGYRAYRASLLRAATARYGDGLIAEAGFQCMLALLLRLAAMHARFAEVPLVLRYDRKRGASKMAVARTVRDSLRLLRGG